MQEQAKKTAHFECFNSVSAQIAKNQERQFFSFAPVCVCVLAVYTYELLYTRKTKTQL